MKPLPQTVLYFLLLSLMFITSCKKDSVVGASSPPILPAPPPPTSPPPQAPGLPLPPLAAIHDYLSGSEFTFDDLIWKGDWAVYVEVPNSNIFMNRGIEVSIKSAGTDIEVPFYTFEYPDGTFSYPVNKGYVYDNNWFDDLFVFAIHSGNKQLIGTKVSVKVKVL
jgi:hypothetical protein